MSLSKPLGIRSARSRSIFLIAAILLTLVLVVPTLFASVSSVAAQFVALLLLPLAFSATNRQIIAGQPALLLFIAAFVALTLVYMVTAQTPADILFFANFLALPLAALVYVVASRAAGFRTAMLIVGLCLLGTIIAFSWSLYDVFGRGLARAEGLIGNPNLMSRLALTLGFVSLAGLWIDTTPRRWLWLLGPVLAIGVIVLTGSRGAALAVPPLVVLAGIFLWQLRIVRPVLLAGLAQLRGAPVPNWGWVMAPLFVFYAAGWWAAWWRYR